MKIRSPYKHVCTGWLIAVFNSQLSILHQITAYADMRCHFECSSTNLTKV